MKYFVEMLILQRYKSFSSIEAGYLGVNSSYKCMEHRLLLLLSANTIRKMILDHRL